MVEKELKWYDIFVVLFGTILSFADPITDILTLVEFYRADHKTWFGVGLTFVIFSCVAFSVNYYAPKESELKGVSRARRYTQVFFRCLNPFSPALVKLQTFIFYLKTFKKLWRGEKIKPSDIGTTVDEEAYAIYWLAITSPFCMRPYSNQLLSLLYSYTPWLLNRNL